MPNPSGKKSQVSAPIELFVAVIIMAMSLAIAFYVMNETSCARCLAEQKGESQKLADAMHAVTLGFSGSKQSLIYSMRACCESQVDGIRFARYTSREFCGKCPGGLGGGCWRIEPVGYDREGRLVPFADASVCVDMSESLEVDPAPCGGEDLLKSPCPKKDGQPLTTSECKEKSYYVECGTEGWWGRDSSDCVTTGAGTTGIARFKTLSRDDASATYRINMTKTVVANGKVGLQVCSKPMQ